MIDETPIDENAAVAEIAKAMEAEGLEQSADVDRYRAPSATGVLEYPSPPPGAHDGLYAPIPLADLRARLDACVKAGVISYRDGPLELKFDPDARTRNAGTIQTPGEIVRF